MERTVKILQGNSEEEIWSHVQEDLKGDEPFVDDYEVVLQQQGTSVHLLIEIDLGGGFESGFESTTLVSQLYLKDSFSFLLQKEGFLVEVGKLFGMEDVEIGDIAFDDAVRIKTNNVDRIKQVLRNKENRMLIKSLDSYELSLIPDHHDPSLSVLKLQLDEAIVDAVRLREIYHVFGALLGEIEASNS